MSLFDIRFLKIKYLDRLATSFQSVSLASPVQNPDSSLGSNLQILFNPSHDIIVAWNERVGSQKIRTNAVLAIKIVASYSPDWAGDEKTWSQNSFEWLKRVFGVKNVISCVIYHTEKTPHLQALVVPLDSKGNLNCRTFLGGAAKLVKLQNSYFDAMASLSFSSDHDESKEIQKFYSQVENSLKKSEQATQKINLRTGSNTEQQNRQESNSQFSVSKTVINRLRSLNLAAVAKRLGAEQNKSDPQKWTFPNGEVIALEKDGSRFHAVEAGGGGHGAIDLVMRILETDFKEAVDWLSKLFLDGPFSMDLPANTEGDSVKESKTQVSFAPPQVVEDNWPTVMQYLIEVRFLPEDVISKLHETGDLYSDKFSNVVFCHKTPSGEIAGVEIRGTGKTPFKGAKGLKTGFFVKGKIEGLVICESAIDSLSCFHLTGMSAVGVGGSNLKAAKIWAQWGKNQGIPVYVGFDNDPAGMNQTMALRTDCPWAMIKKPDFCKDWNEALIFKISKNTIDK